MAIGDSGRAVRNTVATQGPSEFASRLGAHIHKGAPEATIGGPGATKANGAALEGSDGSSPYGDGGDMDCP